MLDANAPNLGGLKGQQLENVPLWNANASAKYLFTPMSGYDAFLRANVFDKQAALSEFLSDNYSATTRVRMFTNQPRTTGLSLRWKF